MPFLATRTHQDRQDHNARSLVVSRSCSITPLQVCSAYTLHVCNILAECCLGCICGLAAECVLHISQAITAGTLRVHAYVRPFCLTWAGSCGHMWLCRRLQVRRLGPLFSICHTCTWQRHFSLRQTTYAGALGIVCILSTAAVP
jgi:hypothetical protein